MMGPQRQTRFNHSRRYNAAMSEDKFTVSIEDSGRCGLIHYREGEDYILFDWEFCGAPAVVTIWPRDLNPWDEIHPWAAGRKIEILENVAREVCRQESPTCSFEIEAADSSITLFERKHESKDSK